MSCPNTNIKPNNILLDLGWFFIILDIMIEI